ncbi:MAG: RimJ/RimL family protein N-acetyltransferase [Crocinitomicaceae bacterium]|jgi:RimJ/RimL family protein N-acetyltransferase
MINYFIRPLEETDALISCHWRNNPTIWEHTGSRPDIIITHEIELEWIKKVLLRKDEKRFAICDSQLDKYIGNAQLTNIEDGSAEFHIFIGETSYWGKGVSIVATKLILEHAREILKLEKVYSWVSIKNVASLKMCERSGFRQIEEKDELLKMSVSLIE